METCVGTKSVDDGYVGKGRTKKMPRGNMIEGDCHERDHIPPMKISDWLDEAILGIEAQKGKAWQVTNEVFPPQYARVGESGTKTKDHERINARDLALLGRVASCSFH